LHIVVVVTVIDAQSLQEAKLEFSENGRLRRDLGRRAVTPTQNEGLWAFPIFLNFKLKYMYVHLSAFWSSRRQPFQFFYYHSMRSNDPETSGIELPNSPRDFAAQACK